MTANIDLLILAMMLLGGSLWALWWYGLSHAVDDESSVMEES